MPTASRASRRSVYSSSRTINLSWSVTTANTAASTCIPLVLPSRLGPKTASTRSFSRSRDLERTAVGLAGEGRAPLEVRGHVAKRLPGLGREVPLLIRVHMDGLGL